MENGIYWDGNWAITQIGNWERLEPYCYDCQSSERDERKRKEEAEIAKRIKEYEIQRQKNIVEAEEKKKREEEQKKKREEEKKKEEEKRLVLVKEEEEEKERKERQAEEKTRKSKQRKKVFIALWKIALTVAIIYALFLLYGFFRQSMNAEKIITATAIPEVVTENYETPAPFLSTNEICPDWNTVETNLSGNRYDIWEKIVSKQSSPMEWEVFKERVLICNPVLVQDNFVFINGKKYILP